MYEYCTCLAFDAFAFEGRDARTRAPERLTQVVLEVADHSLLAARRLGRRRASCRRRASDRRGERSCLGVCVGPIAATSGSCCDSGCSCRLRSCDDATQWKRNRQVQHNTNRIAYC